MMHDKGKFIAGLMATVLVAPICFAQEFDHRYYPSTPIDPSLGVKGDFSGTYQYWKDDAAIKKNSAMITDPEQNWKLNYKYLDTADSDDLHPGVLAVDAGEALVKKWEKAKPGFIACLSSGSGTLKGVATGYPMYDKKLKRLMTLDGRVEYCSDKVLGKRFKQTKSPKQNAFITTYIKSLSTGMPIAIDVSTGPMKAAYLRGEKLFYKRVGQLNLSCAGCHVPGSLMGVRLRGEVSTTPFGDMAHMPTYRAAGGDTETVHKRFMRCLKLQRSKPLPLGHPAYTDLEIFYTNMSNGHPIKVPSIR